MGCRTPERINDMVTNESRTRMTLVGVVALLVMVGCGSQGYKDAGIPQMVVMALSGNDRYRLFAAGDDCIIIEAESVNMWSPDSKVDRARICIDDIERLNAGLQ